MHDKGHYYSYPPEINPSLRGTVPGGSLAEPSTETLNVALTEMGDSWKALDQTLDLTRIKL